MTTAPRTHVQNPTDPVDGCALDKDGGGGGKKKGGAKNGLDTGDMEDRVDATKISRKKKSHCDRINDLRDTEWTNEPRGQLARSRLKGKVLSGEPNSLTATISRTLSSTLISSPHSLRPITAKCRPDPLPGALATLDKSLSGGDAGLGELR